RVIAKRNMSIQVETRDIGPGPFRFWHRREAGRGNWINVRRAVGDATGWSYCSGNLFQIGQWWGGCHRCWVIQPSHALIAIEMRILCKSSLRGNHGLAGEGK